MNKLILQRHTTPDILPGTCYGRTDLDLAASFETEREQLYPQLPRFDRIISSPLQRCRRLADYVSKMSGVPVEIDSRLVEFDFGVWELQRWDEIPRQELDAWAENFKTAKPHGGESVEELETRLDALLRDWAEQPKQTTLVVSHAGVIRAIVALIEDVDMNKVEIDFGEHRITHNPYH